MKINYFQLEQHLSKAIPAKAYLVSGEDAVLKQDALQMLRKCAQRHHYTERVKYSATELDSDKLHALLYGHSMFSEKQLIEFDFRDTPPNKQTASVLQGYADKPVDGKLLIIYLGKLEIKISKSSWYQSLEKISTCITIWPPTSSQVTQWVTARAKKYKLQFEDGALNFLIECIDGQLSTAQQLLEKIYLYQQDSPVGINLIRTLLTDEGIFNIFDLVDTILTGHLTKAVTILQHLRAQGTEPILILWAVARELRVLSRLAEGVSKGTNLRQLLQAERVFSTKQASISFFLSKFNLRDCHHLLRQAAELDKTIKGANTGDIWQQLEIFILRFHPIASA